MLTCCDVKHVSNPVSNPVDEGMLQIGNKESIKHELWTHCSFHCELSITLHISVLPIVLVLVQRKCLVIKVVDTVNLVMCKAVPT